MPDGVLLVPSRAFVFHSDQDYLAGFQQSPNFFYFTGLPSAAGAVLAIDGAAKETWLFVPTKLPGIAGILKILHGRARRGLGEAARDRSRRGPQGAVGVSRPARGSQARTAALRARREGSTTHSRSTSRSTIPRRPGTALSAKSGRPRTSATPSRFCRRCAWSRVPPRSRSCAASASRAPRPSTPA